MPRKPASGLKPHPEIMLAILLLVSVLLRLKYTIFQSVDTQTPYQASSTATAGGNSISEECIRSISLLWRAMDFNPFLLVIRPLLL